MKLTIKSQEYLKRALELFPTGAQTAMKTALSFPVGIAPLFAESAKGSLIRDLDGNRYVDFVAALGAVTLGYAEDSVNRAVSEQLSNGTLFSLSHPLELEVAEILRDMIPCCEMVRFGKNGSDMTTTAIRLARAYTNREHVALCGYHGWHDWSAAHSPLHAGIPEAISKLTHVFRYNDLASVDELFSRCGDELAAIILEPFRFQQPQDGFLEILREKCTKNGTVLIFDEIVTGFRIAVAGAQELFGVVPDLAVYGKGLSNGFPLSALVGRTEIMRHLKRVHASLTYGGETLSLAAAKATLLTYRNEPVIAHFKSLGRRLAEGLRKLLDRYELHDAFLFGGDAAWLFLLPKESFGYTEAEIRTFFLQEMFAKGFLVLGAHCLMYAHREEEIDALLKAYEETFIALSDAVKTHSLGERLLVDPPKESTTRWR